MRNILFLLIILPGLFLQAGELKKDLLIVTTNAIKNSSQKLADFIIEKENRGFTVTVATETQYGAADKKGQERAIAIRNWLKTVYADHSFLLLIGDAHSQYGDIPMFKVWPRYSYSTNECGGFAIDCRSFETDVPYAELTGNWDLNGNGQWGEQTLDDGPGGIDFGAELITGRIPVYFGDTAPLDTILGNAIAYMNQKKDEISYRKKILLPASFYYFKGQKMSTFTYPFDVDGSETPEWFIKNYLADRKDIVYTRLYEQEGVTVSKYTSELPLTEENIVSEWRKGYGMVWWFGHGLEKGVARTIWKEDTNGDNLAQGEEIIQPNMINSADAAKITGNNSAFVVAVSCEVGSAETPDNLSFALLLSGGSIGIVGSTNVTPGDTTDYANPDSQLDKTSYGASNLGIYFFDSTLNGEYPAKAFFDTKITLGTSASIEAYAGKMMLNYFGDPTLTINDTSEDAAIKPADSSSSKGGCSITAI